MAGVVVALVTVWLADASFRASEDRFLGDAAETFALELRAPGADPIVLAADEAHELEHASIGVAVFEGQRHVAGDPALPSLAPNACADHGLLRVCARSAKEWTAVVGRNRSGLDARRTELTQAALIAVGLTALLSGVFSGAVARLVVRPLRSLRDAVAQLSDRIPNPDGLGPAAGLVEIDALRTTLEDTFDRLARSLSQSDRFAHAAAHELRTPLTAMLGELELIAERASPGQREEILRVHKIGRRLSTLVEGLLVLAQLEPPPETMRIDLVDVIETALDALSATERARIQVYVPNHPVFVVGDDALLGSMVNNALDNALKFSAGDVRCQLSRDDARALIVVVDDGPGIALSERELVFQPFFRGKTRAVPGHGLGLALVAHIAELHGGTARFADAPRGARLELSLPYE